MNINLTGKIERKGLGAGTWALITDEKIYELRNMPAEIRHSGLDVNITGKVRTDIMTIAMIGPVLEVESYMIL